MKKIILLLTLVAFSYVTYAQTIGIPEISTKGKNNQPIELSKLNISVFVVDNIATTTYEMHFFNNNNRIMEGELKFPLPNGVTVSRFALDVNGEMREGVVVEKEKATQAFEAVTRRQIDPGIVEVTKGNNFKARVYPIPANGYKKAIIAFDRELTGDKHNYIYQLPLDIKYKLKDFSVKVEVVMSKPKVIKSSHPSINLNFTKENNVYISEYHESNASLNSQLAFSIPKPRKVKKVITYKGSMTSDNYFYVNLDIKKEQKAKPKPKHITIVWDESSSSKHRDIKKELNVLTDYLKWMGSGKIQLFTFSTAIHKKQSFEIVNGECSELISTLKAIAYDGGTDLGTVDFSQIDTDEILLFTDGISNFGEKVQAVFQAPILAINSSNICDHNLLENFASLSNGIYINALELSANEIIKKATYLQKQLIKAKYDSQKIKDLYPGIGTKVTNHFSCSGIMEGAKSELTLYFGYGKEITESYTVTIDNTKGISNNLGERIWAQKKLKALLTADDESAVKAHGKKFNLVTPGTSLIVLDNVEDYVRYEIVPPPSLQEQYHKIMENRNQKAITNRQNRIARICKLFEADKTWWENVKDYRNVKWEKPKQYKQKSAQNPTVTRQSQVPPPPPPPEVVSELEIVEADEEAELEEVVVINYSNQKNKEATKRPISLIPSVKIKAWDSNAPYINELKSVDTKDIYAAYLKIKPQYEDSPSFYFDVATYLFQKSLMQEGLRVVSNLAELELENVELLRTLGRKLVEYKFYDKAIAVFKAVMKIRSFEPQSYIDLGLAYADKGEYQKAINNLYTVIEKNWDNDILSRFNGIELIVLHDINNIIYHHGKGLDLSFINPCFLKAMPLDIRIIIDWDANDTDIDLWVTDPRKEKCSYQNKRTKIGGKISNDMTQGYGPEEFRLKYAIDGKYTIEAKFYGSRKQSVLGKVSVRALVYTKFDTKQENKQVLTIQLEPNKGGTYTIGEIEFQK